jgi:hypothetical protein
MATESNANLVEHSQKLITANVAESIVSTGSIHSKQIQK